MTYGNTYVAAVSNKLDNTQLLHTLSAASHFPGPSVVTAPQVEDKVGKVKMYHVLLFNDPVNTREYVAKTLKEIFGHSKSKAYDIMNHAHTTGFAVCITTSKSEADDG